MIVRAFTVYVFDDGKAGVAEIAIPQEDETGVPEDCVDFVIEWTPELSATFSTK